LKPMLSPSIDLVMSFLNFDTSNGFAMFNPVII
jgi:hypothetical protein